MNERQKRMIAPYFVVFSPIAAPKIANLLKAVRAWLSLLCYQGDPTRY
jgi:hypothetical protein